MRFSVGLKIKKLRKEKNMTIADFAKKAKISSGMISQIENEKVTPTITIMWKIAQALEVSIGYFFNEENEEEIDPVVKKNYRKKILTSNSNRTYELLVPNLNRKIEFIMLTIKENDIHHNDFITHKGEECGLILKGKLKVVIKDKAYILEEGDSISFNSNLPHIYENETNEECISVWAMTPPTF